MPSIKRVDLPVFTFSTLPSTFLYFPLNTFTVSPVITRAFLLLYSFRKLSESGELICLSSKCFFILRVVFLFLINNLYNIKQLMKPDSLFLTIFTLLQHQLVLLYHFL